MKYDIFQLSQKRDAGWSARAVYDSAIEQIRLAEEIGFETAWFAEHHFSNYCLVPSPLLMCAHLAGLTERIRLGAAVVVAPLYHPLRVVQEVAAVDVLTRGRLVLGLGSGYQPFEFARFGVGLEDSVERTMEFLDILELGLTREVFAYDGRFYQVPETPIAIRPTQDPMPEIWLAGLMGRPAVQHRVARSGYCPMVSPAWMSTQFLAKARAGYDALLAKVGRDPVGAPFGVQRFIAVTDDPAEAREAAERARYSSRLSQSLTNDTQKLDGVYVREEVCSYEPTLEECLRNYVIGPAEQCIETLLADYELLRPSHILCTLQLGGLPHDRVMRTLERLGTEVIPGVEKELARRGHRQPAPVRQQPFQAAAE